MGRRSRLKKERILDKPKRHEEGIGPSDGVIDCSTSVLYSREADSCWAVSFHTPVKLYSPPFLAQPCRPSQGSSLWYWLVAHIVSFRGSRLQETLQTRLMLSSRLALAPKVPRRMHIKGGRKNWQFNGLIRLIIDIHLPDCLWEDQSQSGVFSEAATALIPCFYNSKPLPDATTG